MRKEIDIFMYVIKYIINKKMSCIMHMTRAFLIELYMCIGTQWRAHGR